MSPDRVRLEIANEEIKRLKQELAASKQQIAHMARAAAQHRKARSPVSIIPQKRSTARREDTIRVIIPDSHGSAIDRAAAAAFLHDLEQIAPHEIVLLGDHVDVGGHLAEHHVLGYVAQSTYSYAEDIAAANAFLDAVQRAAPAATIHYIEGNHERRGETWCVTKSLRSARDAEHLRQLYAPEFLLRLKERGIRYYRQGEFYGGLSVPGTLRLGKCYFWHGTSAAKSAAHVNVAKLGGNIVFGHTHREESVRVRPVDRGGIGAWNPGCLCKLQPLWRHTDPTSWTHGYATQTVARSGKFLHLNIPIIDGESLFIPLASQMKHHAHEAR